MTHKLTLIIILLSVTLMTSCGSREKSKTEIAKEKIDECVSNASDYGTCIEIVKQNEDLFSDVSFDSTIVASILQKITAKGFSKNISGEKIAVSGELKDYVVIDKAVISFEEHEEGWTEKNLGSLFSDDNEFLKDIIYPVVNLKLTCRVVKRFPYQGTNDRNSCVILDSPVMVQASEINADYGFDAFVVKDEDIADNISSNLLYGFDDQKQREVLLRYKLWDDSNVKNAEDKIRDRTEKVFKTLATIQTIENLDLSFNRNAKKEEAVLGIAGVLSDITIKALEGEKVYTGPRGGTYVIRDGKKVYVKVPN